MDRVTFIAHPEWIKEEEQTIFRDLGSALRVCFTQLQIQHPEWELTLLQSDGNTLTTKVSPLYLAELLEQIYQETSDLMQSDATDWLRITDCMLASEVPNLVEPPAAPDPGEPAAPPDDSDVLDELCRLPVIQEYPMLADCLRSQANTIRMLQKMDLESCVWDQNLLVAMDDELAFLNFMDALYKVYRHAGLTAPTAPEKFRCYKVHKWDVAVSTAEKFSYQTPKQRSDILLVIDVQRAGFEQNSEKIRSALQQISGMDKNFLCVFRTQVLEMDLIERMIDDINDIMPVRAIVAPPAGTKVLTECFKTSLTEVGCTFSGDCDRLIEQWIVQERSASGLSGQQLTDRLAKELILHKAQVNLSSGDPDHTITPEDILQCMGGVSSIVPLDARQQLDALVGVREIKQHILEIAAQIKVQRELEAQGVESPAIHMLFTGNPGTGKTIVARIIASILHEEGILSKGLLFEVNARELCGQHIGETAPKVSAKCRDAYGSVLFVDEAYTLCQKDNQRDFAQEAITTLMTEMENHRNDFCVILAGYPDEMEQLMTVNPGLRSRIPYTIHFPNYSREELSSIFFTMLEGHFAYDASLKSAAEVFFRSIPDEVINDPNFSNARMVRNLYERVWGKAAYRKVLNKEDALVLRSEDLAAALGEQDFRRLVETPAKKRPIGFAR